ncbi:MAG: hypothetical protein JW904_00535 [Spirochaetales bacterium]|nr:hypothetical protein [Spirochaetales bacterium]
MNELFFMVILGLHIVVNIPNLILLLIGFFTSFSRTIQKSSKILFALGMLFLLFGLIPTILVNYGYNEFINNYSFGYALYLASLFTGDVVAFIFLGISLLREYSLLVSGQRRLWITSLVMLALAYGSALTAVFIPNWGVLFALLFLRWVFGLLTCILLLITLGSLKTKTNKKTKTGQIQNIGQYLIKAQALRSDILKLVNGNADIRRELGDIEPLLNKSVEQVKVLVKRQQEIVEYLKAFSAADNERQLQELRYKENVADTALLKKEFQKAIAEHEKQHASLKELNGQVQIIELRVTSAVSGLEKLKIDAVHMKNVNNISEPASLMELRQKTKDISDFMKDYKESFEELETL